MHRRRSSTARCALAFSALVLLAGCGGSPEASILDDFFRASRLRDNTTLGNFATTEFDPRTDGIVQSFDVTSVENERRIPMPLKDYVQDIEDAQQAERAFNEKKRAYQNENIAAIDRIMRAEAAGRQIPARDRDVKEAWDKWQQETASHLKAIADARKQLADVRGLAELSLARVRPPVEDVTRYNGEIVSKDVMLDAEVRTPAGQTEQRTLKATVTQVRLVGDDGRDIEGRWLVTGIGSAAG